MGAKNLKGVSSSLVKWKEQDKKWGKFEKKNF
jgi:hypothetical protein